MSDDNIGRFMSYHDDDDDDDNESWKPVNQFGKALYRKSVDILNLAQTLCDMLPENDDHAAHTEHMIMQNACIIPAKIKGAMAMEYYSLMIENAVIVKVNAVELCTALWACSTMHGIDQKYVDVIREEIEVFRKIFINWVGAFDKTNDLPDEWHLFNDPASFPEDDEPFDPNNFLGKDDTE